jgi:hypothetical protein
MESSPYGYNWDALLLGIKICEPGPQGWGNHESGRVEYCHESRGTRTRQ